MTTIVINQCEEERERGFSLVLTFEHLAFLGMIIDDDERRNRCPPVAPVSFSTCKKRT